MKHSKNFGGIFDIEGKQSQISDLEAQTTVEGFWNDNEKAQSILKQINNLKAWTSPWNDAKNQKEDLETYLELAKEEDDESAYQDVNKQLNDLEIFLQDLELKAMLSGDDDDKNAILTIHPGAGGTESQDWADMLFRMYIRYAEKNGYQANIMDYQDGDEAGLKSATIEISGEFAYGYLKAEAGVHRLVRISPFDAGKRRHTSFASVFVLPEISGNIEVEIDPNDLRIDTYRASGAGGQHVNKTSSAVRITHIPTNIVVQCQNERSQHQNKANAMKMLTSKLYQIQKEEENKKLEKMTSEKKNIAWGSQIRSYVFHPYNMVKDHRTNVETGNIQSVMDGNLNDFVKAYLLEFSVT